MAGKAARSGGRSGAGVLRDRWKLIVLAVFAASRLVLVFADTPGSMAAGVNVVYAFEMQRAAAVGLPFYEMHEQNRQEAEPSSAPAERLVEYPPLSLVWMAIPTWFLEPIPKFGFVPEKQIAQALVATKLATFCIDCCGFALLLLTGASVARLAFYTAGGLLLFPFVLDRFDLVLGVMLLAALLLLCRRVSIWAPMAMLALAINFKVTPVVLIPVFVLGTLPADALSHPDARRLRHLLASRTAMLAGLCAIFFLPFFARDGSGTLGFLQYHAARGLEIESVWATIPIALAAVLELPAAATTRYGAVELQSGITGFLAAIATLATLAVIPVLVPVTVRLLRGGNVAQRSEGSTLAQANPALFIRLAAVSLLTAMVVAKVLSPQYLLWLLPLGALWEGRQERWVSAVFLLICALTTVVYPFTFGALQEAARASKGSPHWYRVVSAAPLIARNLLLIGLTAWCWRNPGPRTRQ